MQKIDISNPQTLGDWAYLAIEKHFSKIINHEADVIKDKDPEAVHQMRVGIRRLRSTITGFAVALDLPKEAQEKHIAKIANVLGNLRDLDVLMEILIQYHSTLPISEQEYLEKVIKQGNKKRKQASIQVKSTLKSQNYQTLRWAWQKWLKQPKYQDLASLPINKVLPAILLPSVSQLLINPGWLIGVSITTGNIEIIPEFTVKEVEIVLAEKGKILHNLRKKIKQVRYLMELFTNFYGAEYLNYLQDLKTMQEILGKIQDSVVLAEFMVEILQSNITVKMPTLSNQLIENRYQLWQDWRQLQQKYLEDQIVQSFYTTVVNR